MDYNGVNGHDRGGTWIMMVRMVMIGVEHGL